MKSIIAVLSFAIVACNTHESKFAAVGKPVSVSATRGANSTTLGTQASAAVSRDAIDATERVFAPRGRFAQIQQAQTLNEAIAIARPEMVDALERTSTGTLLLAVWALKAMRWTDVAVRSNETTHSAAMDDTEHQRGKRLCVSATLGAVQIDHFAQGDVHTGIMKTASGDLYHYAVVGSADGLGDTGTFCGVVTGKIDYTSSSGAVRTAVQVVGMFDVPRNHPG